MGIVGLFKSELQKLFSTKTIIFTLIGLLLIPIVYAAILLSSTWGPYDYKDNLPVAVVNNDKGAESDGEPINVGNDLVETLKEGKALGWDFVSQEEANKGLKENKYYMVIEIPEDFSQKVTTVLDANPQVPEIKYIRNEGMNFMASQVTNSAVEKIREQLGDKITATFATKVFNRFPDIANGFLSGADGAKQIKDGTIQLADGTNTMLSSLQQKAPDINRLAAGAKTASEGANTLNSSVKDGTPRIKQLNSGAGQIANGINSLAVGSKKLQTGVNNGIDSALNQLDNGIEKALDENMPSALTTALNQGLPTALNKALPTALEQGLEPALKKALPIALEDGLNQALPVAINTGIVPLLQQELPPSVNDGLNGGLKLVLPTAIQGALPTALEPALKNAINQILTNANLDPNDIQTIIDNTNFNTIATGIANTISTPVGTGIADNISQPIASSLSTGIIDELKTKMGAAIPQLSASIAKPVGEGIAQPVAKGIAKPVGEGIAQPVAKGIAGPVADGISSPIADGFSSKISSSINYLSTQLKAGIGDGFKEVNAGIGKLQDGSKELANGTQTLVGSWNKLSNGAGSLASGLTQIADGNQTVATGWNTLIDGTTKLNEGAGKLRDGSDQLATGLDGGYEQVSAVKVSDDNINMIASPVKLTGEDVNKYEYYRDSTAPYILSLSLFVTLLISSFFIDFKKPATTPGSAISWFISKWLTLALFAIVEALLVSLFVLLGLKLSVTNPGLFILFAMFVSVTFMSIILFFVAIGQRVGRFLALAFIVLQLSITGANLPIPMLPDYLRSLTKFLPLTYSNTGFNSVINLGDSSLLAQNASVLLIYLVVTTLIALAIFLFNFKSMKAPQVQAQAVEA